MSICDKWDSVEKPRQIDNYQMVVETKDSKRIPTYRIEPGVSRIEGAIDILTTMEYPEEMLELMETKVEQPEPEPDIEPEIEVYSYSSLHMAKEREKVVLFFRVLR